MIISLFFSLLTNCLASAAQRARRRKGLTAFAVNHVCIIGRSVAGVSRVLSCLQWGAAFEPGLPGLIAAGRMRVATCIFPL